MNIEIEARHILEFVKWNTGTKRFNVNSRKWEEKKEMTKSQAEVNIVVILQFLTGLRMNEVVKLEYKQVKALFEGKKIRVELSKKKEIARRVIELRPTKENKKLIREFKKIAKMWLTHKQTHLVVAKNMEKKEKILKKPNGKQYKTYYYPYIDSFNGKLNKRLKEFKEYMEFEKDIEVLPNHIEKLTTHGFRNNYIVRLYGATNNDLSKTKAIIGHSDIKLTDRYITKFISQDTTVTVI
jgi:integrase